MKTKYIIAFVALFILASCTTAKKASEVAAVYVPASNYANLDCEQLFQAAEEIRSKTPALAAAVDASRKNEKVKEQVAWWLFAPVALLMDLDGNAAEQTNLALARGQLEAIRNAAIKAQCSV